MAAARSIAAMVRRDVRAKLIPEGGEVSLTCCATPTGESPVPVGVGAPGSRSQVQEGDLRAQAGRQKPVRRRESRSGEQARGPQHEVKPAASTDVQPAGRAAHVTAKATPLAQGPKRAGGCGGVWGAARVQGVVRNTRDPSARPESGQARSYKPKAKSRRVQREAEGIVVLDGGAQAAPTKAVWHDAAGGKGPAVVMLRERVSAREWPARPDLTTPVARNRKKTGHATKCDNCKDSSGPQPSGHWSGVCM